jgi:phosphoglycolate phosphatase
MARTPPKLSSFKALALDLDGTLVDTVGDFSAALEAMASELSLACPNGSLAPAAVEPMVGRGSEHLVRSALTRLLAIEGAGGEDLTRQIDELQTPALASYQRHYQRINGLHAQVYPGVAQALAAWTDQGLLMACLTNKPLAFAETLLERKGLRQAFTHVFGGDSFARKKPDPMPLLGTCRALGQPPVATLMVGDSVNDAQAARAAGCAVVLVTYGYNHGQPVREIDADGHVDCLLDLH